LNAADMAVDAGGWTFASNFPWVVVLVVVLCAAVVFLAIRSGSHLKAKIGPAELEIRPPRREVVPPSHASKKKSIEAKSTLP
jgi:hypothetical protein